MADQNYFSQHERQAHALPNDAPSGAPGENVNGTAEHKIKGEDGRYLEMQSAPRFPIKLPAAVKASGADYPAETQNISANGVLLQMDSDMPVGSTVDFTIALPVDVTGSEAHVQLDCRGRVVRSFEDGGRRGVGVVIDEYRFDRG